MAGTMSGTVRNIRNNQPIYGASVSANPGGHSTASGDDGSWSISPDAGSYELEITASGFDPFVAEGIVVLDDVTTELPTALWPSDD